ncbi:MAG: hypothetical protein WBV64_04375 [Mycobacterium sp.]
MTIDDGADTALTLASKVNRLFELYRTRDEPEQSEVVVARSVSRILGRAVAATEIADLRIEGSDDADPALVKGLVRHFGVPEAYLTTSGAHANNLDKQLRLLVAARDAGVKRLALRGLEPHHELDSIFAVLKKIGALEGTEPPLK